MLPLSDWKKHHFFLPPLPGPEFIVCLPPYTSIVKRGSFHFVNEQNLSNVFKLSLPTFLILKVTCFIIMILERKKAEELKEGKINHP